MVMLGEIARLIGAELEHGDEAVEVYRVARPAEAGPDALVFAEDEDSLAAALNSGAAAVLVTRKAAESIAVTKKPLLVTKHPKLGFARAGKLLRIREAATGIHPTAVVASDAVVGDGVSVAAYAVVEVGASIGKGSSIGAGVVIGRDVHIGKDCHIYPRVVIYPGTKLGDRVVAHAGAVLGGDGFGYVRDAETGEYIQFPQQGVLVIEDDVEIGANTTIDRGALAETRIGRGVKLDNLVHVGHNVRIEKNVVIAAQTGVSGSSTVGENAIVGGQVGIADHVTIGEGAILGAQAGIPSHKQIRGPGVVFWGTPAKPIREYLKELATLARLTRQQSKKNL